MPKELWLLQYLVWIRGYTVFMTGCYRMIFHLYLTVYYSYSYIYTHKYITICIYIYIDIYKLYIYIYMTRVIWCFCGSQGIWTQPEAPRLQREVPCDHGTQRPAEALLVALVALGRQWQALRVAVLGLLTGAREVMPTPQISGGTLW